MPWGAIYAELGIDIVQPTPDVRTLVLRARLAYVYHFRVTFSLYTISSVSVLGSFLMNDAAFLFLLCYMVKSVQDRCADCGCDIRTPIRPFGRGRI